MTNDIFKVFVNGSILGLLELDGIHKSITVLTEFTVHSKIKSLHCSHQATLLFMRRTTPKQKFQIKEQIFIIYAVNSILPEYIELAAYAIESFKLRTSLVRSVILTSFTLAIPKLVKPGETLNSLLVKRMSLSIGAIVFVDNLRPNVLYELGFFHGQKKPVLLITTKDVSDFFRECSDLNGVGITVIGEDIETNSSSKLADSINQYLTDLFDEYAKASKIKLYGLPEIQYNQINSFLPYAHKDAKYFLKTFEYGSSLEINTWGGAQYDVTYDVTDDAYFQLLIRAKEEQADYSIYFLIDYLNSFNIHEFIVIGITSIRVDIDFNADERLLPGERIGLQWKLISMPFKELLVKGKVLGKNTILSVGRLRFRAGRYNKGPDFIHKAYDIGYFRIIGLRES